MDYLPRRSEFCLTPEIIFLQCKAYRSLAAQHPFWAIKEKLLSEGDEPRGRPRAESWPIRDREALGTNGIVGGNPTQIAVAILREEGGPETVLDITPEWEAGDQKTLRLVRDSWKLGAPRACLRPFLAGLRSELPPGQP